MFNAMQRQVLQHYQDGEYRNAKSLSDIRDFGDPLLVYVLAELSENEHCESVDEGIARLDAAIHDLMSAKTGLVESPL